LKVGEILKVEDLVFKRPGNGIQISDLSKVIGKKMLKNVPKDFIVKYSDIDI
jgi:sialic acid synthase SpsE